MNEETIFATARQRKEGTERRDFLDQACAGKPELRAQVEALLRADAQAGSLLDYPPGMNATTNINPEKSAQADADIDHPSLSFLSPCDKPDRIGKLGPYEVFEVLGRGGMGIVLRGLDLKLNRVVAIKVLAPEFASNAMFRKRFLREAQAAAAVSHDHVVTIHAVEDDATVPCLVMECIIGQSLQQKIDRVGALQLREILRIGMQIAMGLTAAHKQGLIHRDIKPANILLENGVERVKITDFGLARATDDVGITQSGVIAGTPLYMSPEQAMGEPIDQRSDLFSLGSVLYTMCTGRPAFRADTTIAVIRRVCDDSPRPIEELNPEIPDWLVAIIDKLLAKKPEDRFRTAAEVAELLEQHLAQIQQSSLTSGHRAARKRTTKRPESQANPTDRSDFIWSCVGILTLLMLIVGWGVRFLRPATAEPSMRTVFNPESNDLAAEVGTQSSRQDSTHSESATREDQQSGAVANSTRPPLAISPFDAEQARRHQAAWKKYLGLDDAEQFKLPNGMTFELIPPGEFQMGSSPEEISLLSQELENAGASEFDKFSAKSSLHRHRVQLSQPFLMSRHEVTVAQFRKFAESPENAGKVPSPSRYSWKVFVADGPEDQQPVIGVSWDEANAFCKWMSQNSEWRIDLPTEAQWEYACRAGSSSLWTFGDDPALLESHAIVEQKGTPKPAFIGLKSPNAFGLYDMHGNANEWCLDWHMKDFYRRSPLRDPVATDNPTDPGSGRVSRGGSWNADAWWSRSASRAYDFQSDPVHPKGFRVVIQNPHAVKPTTSEP